MKRPEGEEPLGGDTESCWMLMLMIMIMMMRVPVRMESTAWGVRRKKERKERKEKNGQGQIRNAIIGIGKTSNENANMHPEEKQDQKNRSKKKKDSKRKKSKRRWLLESRLGCSIHRASLHPPPRFGSFCARGQRQRFSIPLLRPGACYKMGNVRHVLLDFRTHMYIVYIQMLVFR